MSSSTNPGAVFKRPDYTQWNGQQQSAGASVPAFESRPGLPQKKKRPKSSMSNPSQNRLSDAGTNRHRVLATRGHRDGRECQHATRLCCQPSKSTSLLSVVCATVSNHVQSTPNPMRLQDIAIVTNTPLDSDRVLLEKFRAHDCIHWDPKTDLYSYKVLPSPMWNVLVLN